MIAKKKKIYTTGFFFASHTLRRSGRPPQRCWTRSPSHPTPPTACTSSRKSPQVWCLYRKSVFSCFISYLKLGMLIVRHSLTSTVACIFFCWQTGQNMHHRMLGEHRFIFLFVLLLDKPHCRENMGLCCSSYYYWIDHIRFVSFMPLLLTVSLCKFNINV